MIFSKETPPSINRCDAILSGRRTVAGYIIVCATVRSYIPMYGVVNPNTRTVHTAYCVVSTTNSVFYCSTQQLRTVVCTNSNYYTIPRICGATTYKMAFSFSSAAGYHFYLTQRPFCECVSGPLRRCLSYYHVRVCTAVDLKPDKRC